jgi:Protein of unknown function with PCYCGC motif
METSVAWPRQGKIMRIERTWVASGVLVSCMAAAVLIPISARPAGQQAGGEEPVPAYHTQVPAGELPQPMDPAEFANPVVKNSYALAAKVKKVLYQEPCYCHCDRSVGHGSLLDCFTSKHGSGCNICMAEALYSYEQTKKRKTPAQIREGIQKGEWRQIDAAKYETYPAKP